MSRPSIGRSSGSDASQTAARVGKRSIAVASSEVVPPAATRPGQRAMQGTLIPPSQVVPLVPRSGELLPPPSPAREPLSLVKTTRVLSSRPNADSSRRTIPRSEEHTYELQSLMSNSDDVYNL